MGGRKSDRLCIGAALAWFQQSVASDLSSRFLPSRYRTVNESDQFEAAEQEGGLVVKLQ